MPNQLQLYLMPQTRRGLSLIEVIACTALVAMLMLPMAGVLRVSGQAIRDSQTNSFAGQSMPNAALALQRYVQSCDEILKYGDNVLVMMRQGQVIELHVNENRLVARGGKDDLIIVDEVRSMRFKNEFRDQQGRIHAVTTTLEPTDSKTEPNPQSWNFVLAIER